MATETKIYKQVELVSGNTYMVCWLPSEGLRIGMPVVLDGDDTMKLWKVNWVYNKLPMPVNALPQEWKVGGIDYATGHRTR